MTIDGASDIGQHEPASLAAEEPLVEQVLELADLCAHGRLRETQLVAASVTLPSLAVSQK